MLPIRRECDWADFRRELALPNSDGDSAGRFAPLLWTLHDLEDHVEGVSRYEYDYCHSVLLTMLFKKRRGVVLDPKRGCAWALDVQPV